MREQELRDKLRRFHRVCFTSPNLNRFENLFERGQEAFPDLIRALQDPTCELRIDALLMLGRIFHTHGYTHEALRMVVEHSQKIEEDGLGKESQASLFALGRSRESSLMDAFVEVLTAHHPLALCSALMVLGHARWKAALPVIIAVARQDQRSVSQTAIWAMGQIGDPAALDFLLSLLREAKYIEWIPGALGDIGSVDALEDLVPLLHHSDTEVRTLSAASMWAIIGEHKNREQRRHLGWLSPLLLNACQDPHPVTALWSAMILAKLGVGIPETTLNHILSLPLTNEASDATKAMPVTSTAHI
jgi:HEAT repeat protein